MNQDKAIFCQLILIPPNTVLAVYRLTMGSKISAVVTGIVGSLIMGLGRRDVAGLPSSLKPFISPSAALATMPTLLETRPWRRCTDSNGMVWDIAQNNTLTSRATDTFEIHAVANEAYRRSEYMVIAVPGGNKEKGIQDTKVIYHVPGLEAWANRKCFSDRGRETANELTSVAESSSRSEAHEPLYDLDGVAMIHVATDLDADKQIAQYRGEFDIKPGVFELALQDGSVEIKCPGGIEA